MLKVDTPSQIKRFREVLDRLMYDQLFIYASSEINYMFNPWQKANIIENNIRTFPPCNAFVFRFFLMGIHASIEDFVSYVGAEELQLLQDINYVTVADGIVSPDGYSVVSYNGLYLVVSTPFLYEGCKDNTPTIYIGQDSYRLSRIIPRIRGNGLDLCTGSGIQAIVQAQTAQRVCAVEIHPEAAIVANFNAILNNSEDIVKVSNGDLYGPLGQQKFDLITANPPFIPVPSEIPYPGAGDGGEDGLDIIRTILGGFEAHLSTNGEAIIIGEALGHDKDVLLSDVAREILGSSFDVEVVLNCRMPISANIESMVGLCQVFSPEYDKEVVRDKYSEMYSRLGVSHYYSFTMRVRRAPDGTGKLSLYNIVPNGGMTQVPRLTEGSVVMEQPSRFEVTTGGRAIAFIDAPTKLFIEACDGVHTVPEVWDTLCVGKGEAFRAGFPLHVALTVFETLLQCNVLESVEQRS